ncbi:MAG: DUF1565 domain-containing protein, partial [Ignavibacteriales bacterium]|nr:DUF1565 domain-containing protein [Ignavibacteriales bacterium]
SDRNIEIMEDGEYVAGSAYMPFLGAYSDYVYDGAESGILGDNYEIISEYTANTLELIAGDRASDGNGYPPGNLHAFFEDLPAENKITIRDVDGALISGASVSIYQSEGDGSTWYSKTYDNTPEMTFTTNASGEVYVGMNPFSVDADIVHEYGKSNTVAIMRVAFDGRVDYQFLDSKDFNYEYWAGNTALGEYDVQTDFSSHEIIMTTPNGGETWRYGTTMDIVWDDAGVTDVKLEYSTNNGTDWTTITTAGSGVTERYTWTVPNVESDQCLIRASDNDDGTVIDVSDATFSIGTPTITTTAPNGGETLTAGDGYDITWSSEYTPTVDIELSTDNGSSWTTIASSVAGDAGSYYWTVSDDPTTTALVRVMDAYQSSFGDTSDAAFTIQSSGATPSVWYVDVSVAASGDGTSEAQAFKTINEGIIAADPYDTIKVLPGTYTSFESTAARDERIAIVSTGGADVTTLDGTGEATGRAFRVKSGWTIDGFTFTNFVATTNPDNNAAIKYRNDVDSTAAIVVRNCVFDGNAKIAVGIDGCYAKTIYEHNVFMNGSDRVFKGEWRELRLYNNTFYNNDGASTDYVGYVYTTGQDETRVDMRNNTIIDNDIDATTDAVFTVEPLATGKTVKLTEGYNLVNDNTPSDAITAGTFSGATTIETRLGNNLAEDPLHISESLGDFALRVGSPLLDAGTNVGLSYDGSAPEIGSYEGVAFDVDVTYPNGGELIAVGDTVRITWEHTNLENVKVEWSTNSGSDWSVVSASTSADDTVEVVAPEILSTDCLIRVSSIEHPGLIDQSDATFTIRVGGDLYVDDDGSPTGSGSALNPVNTIASALAIAVEGDTIHVMDGTYTASVDDVGSSPDKITIRAENQGQAVIDGASEPVFTPKKEWVIDGLKFVNHTGGAVFHFDGDNEYINAAFVTIKNCFFDNNQYILTSTETIDNGIFGTFDKTESAVKMHNNVITGNTDRIANDFYFKRFVFYNNTVVGNTYSGGDYFQLVGNSLGLSPVNFDVRNNVFSDNSIGGSYQFFDVAKDNDDIVDEINVTYGYNLDYNNNGATVITYSGFGTVNENNKVNNVSGSDPLFTDASTDDYTLQATSPAMNVGDDVNLEYFSVAPELGAYENWDSPVVEVTAPNGSESYSIGDAVSITWTQSNLGSATIDYSIDGGVNWIEIATGVSGSTETYAWTVPYPPTDQAIVRITDEFDANAADQSDAVFSISNETITVNASGGADYTNIATALSNAQDGAEIQVAAGTYTAAGIDPPPIGIQLSSSAGAATTIIDGSSLSGLGFTVNEGWTIDGFTFQNFNDGGSASNAVIVFESTSDSAYWATIKNNVFKNSTKLFVGETGSEARAIVHNNVIYDGSERVAYGEWRAFRFLNNTVENVSNTGDNYIIDVFASGQTETRLDVRNNIFSNNTVATGGGAFIHATPSASGNTLILKEGRNLLYNNSPNSTIDYDDVSGANEYVQSFGFDKTTDPSYTDAASDDYNITSASPAVAAGMDVGLPFEGPAPDMGALPYSGTITLTAPNGGESWTSGATETITWTYDNVANVKIEISSDGGSTWVYEIPSTPAAPGSYDLSVPNMPTENAIVRLSIAETETVEDQSDAPFTITSADAPVVDGNTTVETQWSETLFTDATSAGAPSHIQGVYAAHDLTYVYFAVMVEEDDCRDNATIVIDYKPGGPAANSTDPFMSDVRYNFSNQPDDVIHKHGYGTAIAAKRWDGSTWQDRTAPTASPDFYSDYSGGSAHFLEVKLPREEIENANVISLMVYTSEGSNATYPGDADQCAFYAYPEDAGNDTDPTGAATSTTMSVYHEDLVVIPNVNNLLGGPYTADANTVALFHFDGNYTNAGTTTDATAVNSGSQSFVEHSEQALGNLRQALRLDNSNSANKTYLRVADANELDMTGDWTIEMWFKVNSFGPENGYAYSPRLISKPNGGSPVGNYWVNLFGNESAAQAGMRTTSNTYNVILSDSAFIQTGAWYHLSYVHDATKETMAMVIHDANRDPVFVQTKSLAGIANTPVTSTSDLYIGWAGGSLADMFYFD